MRSFLRLASFASFALGSVVWLASAPTIGCGGGSEELPVDTNDTGADPDASTDGPDNDNPVCGNGFKEGVEQCDDGNKENGDGCEADCTLTCKPGPEGDKKCSDGNPCNGIETCGTDNKCTSGTPLAEGDKCGDVKICKGGSCVDAVCGDGIVSGTEECDDGNVVNGDGCDSCKFSCKSTDTARNCSGGDACAGTSTCDDTTHKCNAGTPLADGTTCGTAGGVCKGGVCTAGTCGDGIVSGGEQCDFGTGNGAGTGCQVDCKFSCSKTADTCSDGNVCNGVETCQTVTVSGKTGQKCQPGTAATDGTTCGSGLVCKTGVCVSPSAVCGNGVVEAGEDCDFGTGNGAGTGCETTCKFSCTKTPTDSCNDGNPCNGTETCATVTVGGKTGQKCNAGTSLSACAACGTGAVCVGGTCKSSVCGDACVDSAKGEQCDPPGTSTCDSTCKTVVVAVCGNGKREAGEQCDDGNTKNLDGCDSSCKFEQDHRATTLDMQFTTDTYCTANQLGAAIASSGQTTIKNTLNDGVKAGTTNVLFKFLNLDDLTGTNDSAVTLGNIGGNPATGTGYNGTADLDWWYNVDALTIDTSRNPLPGGLINGSIAAKTLTAGPGNMSLLLQFSTGVVSALNLSNVRIKASIGATSAPKVSTGSTPGHLATENLDPTLQSFATMSAGQLCGAVSAYSLSKVPVPAALLPGGGLSSCDQGYTTANSLLDVIVRGCSHKILLSTIDIIIPKQPDAEDPTAPAVGTGPNYTLSASSTTSKIVDRCKSTGSGGTTYNKGTADFDKCLQDAAYTAYFKFTTDRVIVK